MPHPAQGKGQALTGSRDLAMAFVMGGCAPELTCFMKWPRSHQLVLEGDEGLSYERQRLASCRKNAFLQHGKCTFGLGDPSLRTAPAVSSLQSPSQALLTSPLQPFT